MSEASNAVGDAATAHPRGIMIGRAYWSRWARVVFKIEGGDRNHIWGSSIFSARDDDLWSPNQWTTAGRFCRPTWPVTADLLSPASQWQFQLIAIPDDLNDYKSEERRAELIAGASEFYMNKILSGDITHGEAKEGGG